MIDKQSAAVRFGRMLMSELRRVLLPSLVSLMLIVAAVMVLPELLTPVLAIWETSSPADQAILLTSLVVVALVARLLLSLVRGVRAGSSPPPIGGAVPMSRADLTPLDSSVRHAIAVHEVGHAMTCRLMPTLEDPLDLRVDRHGGSNDGRSGMVRFVADPSRGAKGSSPEHLWSLVLVAVSGRCADVVAGDGVDSGSSYDMERALELIDLLVVLRPNIVPAGADRWVLLDSAISQSESMLAARRQELLVMSDIVVDELRTGTRLPGKRLSELLDQSAVDPLPASVTPTDMVGEVCVRDTAVERREGRMGRAKRDGNVERPAYPATGL